jgi:hypothetical protein
MLGVECLAYIGPNDEEEVFHGGSIGLVCPECASEFLHKRLYG